MLIRVIDNAMERAFLSYVLHLRLMCFLQLGFRGKGGREGVMLRTNLEAIHWSATTWCFLSTESSCSQFQSGKDFLETLRLITIFTYLVLGASEEKPNLPVEWRQRKNLMAKGQGYCNVCLNSTTNGFPFLGLKLFLSVKQRSRRVFKAPESPTISWPHLSIKCFSFILIRIMTTLPRRYTNHHAQ